MTTSIEKIAAIVSLLPVISLAAEKPALHRATRDVTPLTLLSGPNLTSTPRGATPAGPSLRIEPAARLQVGTASGTLQLAPAGTLTLSSENPDKVALPAAKKHLPSPESLRFESKLHAPPAPAWKLSPALKRD